MGIKFALVPLELNGKGLKSTCAKVYPDPPEVTTTFEIFESATVTNALAPDPSPTILHVYVLSAP